MGHSNPTYCIQICLNFLHSQLVRLLKLVLAYPWWRLQNTPLYLYACLHPSFLLPLFMTTYAHYTCLCPFHPLAQGHKQVQRVYLTFAHAHWHTFELTCAIAPKPSGKIFTNFFCYLIFIEGITFQAKLVTLKRFKTAV